MKQPEALRIADFLERAGDYMDHAAAAELRRLEDEQYRLRVQRDALLEACKRYDAWADKTISRDPELASIRGQMRAAIKAAEGEK